MSKEERKDLPDVEIGTAADMDEVMRKYDRESATRIWEGKPKVVVSVISALFSLYGGPAHPADGLSGADYHHGLSELPRPEGACDAQQNTLV